MGRRVLAGFGAMATILALLPTPGRTGQHVDTVMGIGAYVAGLIPGGTAGATFIDGRTFTDEPRTVTCISLAKGLTDSGCRLRALVEAEVDELLETGRLKFTVDSDVFPSGTLTVDVTLQADGSTEAGRPRTFNAQPGGQSRPAQVWASGGAVTLRTSYRVVRSIESSTIGGGSLEPGSSGILFSTQSATIAASTTGAPQSPSTSMASISSAGVQGNSHSSWPKLSSDGRLVAFHSHAANLVEGDANLVADVFVHDRANGLTTRVSVSSSGREGNGRSLDASAISDDGRWVTFTSDASNLVSGDSNDAPDVFLHDRLNGDTTRVSVTTAGAQRSGPSERPALSADGRYVAFESRAPLEEEDTNGRYDIYVHDRVTGATRRVSESSSGQQSNRDSFYASLSREGRYVAFWSEGSTLVGGDENGYQDIFVRDRDTDEDGVFDEHGAVATTLVSSAGTPGNGPSLRPSISEDGRYVAFDSQASNLVSGDDNNFCPGDEDHVFILNCNDVFVHDRVTGTTTRVSVSSSGAQANKTSWTASISADGRAVVYQSLASDLIAGDTNGTWDVFLHDRLDGTTTRVSVSSGGDQGNDASVITSVSSNGRLVAFASLAFNLVEGDANNASDVFVYDTGA